MKLLIILSVFFLFGAGLSAEFTDVRNSEFVGSYSDSDSDLSGYYCSDDSTTICTIPPEFRALSLDELESKYRLNGLRAINHFKKGDLGLYEKYLQRSKEFFKYCTIKFSEMEAEREELAYDVGGSDEEDERMSEIGTDQGSISEVSTQGSVKEYLLKDTPQETYDFSIITKPPSDASKKAPKLNLRVKQGSYLLDTIDGRSISVDYFPPVYEQRGVVILFHGNELVEYKWENTEVFRFFRSIGLGVVIPKIKSSIMKGNFNRSLMFDTEAVINFLVKIHNIKKVRDLKSIKILAFGYSLGSTYATYIASYFRTPLMLQNACEKSEDIIEQWGKYKSRAILSQLRNEDFVSFYDEENLRYYEEAVLRMYEGYTFQDLKQDFGNNIRKISKEKQTDSPIDLMILYSGRDFNCGGYQNSIDLFKSRYGDKYVENNRLYIDEDGDPTQFPNNSVAKLKVLDFLTDNELIPRIELE